MKHLLMGMFAKQRARNEFPSNPWVADAYGASHSDIDHEYLQHCKNGNLKGVRAALRGDADPFAVDTSKFSALHLAAFSRGKEEAASIVRLLLDAGVDPNGHNNIRQTPLHLAATFGMDDVCMLLLAAGSKINAADQCQRTPLWDAAWKGRHSLIDMFMSAGADIHACDNHGNTVLHAGSLGGGNVRTFEKLIGYGADPNAFGESGETVLHRTAVYDYIDLCHVLVDSGADIHATNWEGKTPVEVARGASRAYLEARSLERCTVQVAAQTVARRL